MEQNIFKTKEVVKIHLIYTCKNEKKKETVTFRFLDNELFYLATNTDIDFKKPKKNTKANLIVYTTEGLYETQVIIKNIEWDTAEILYELSPPKNWNFKQLRAGVRKEIELPMDIFFSDGVKLETYISHISISGFNFISNKELTGTQKGLPAKCNLIIPPQILDTDLEYIECGIKYVRRRLVTDDFENRDSYYYSYKFVNLSTEQKKVITTLLMKFY